MGDAIGMVETKGMVPLVHATDAMLKTANVAYKGWRKVGSGFCTVFVPRPHQDLAGVLPK